MTIKILKYFQENLIKLKCIVMFAINIENLKKLKHYIFKTKAITIFIVYSTCRHKYEKSI